MKNSIPCFSIVAIALSANCFFVAHGMKRQNESSFDTLHLSKAARTESYKADTTAEILEKKLAIGIQTFREIIEENYTYVDKTEPLHTYITSGKCYFLSRPRRFGKSLILSTLKEIFLGNRELFENLYIATTDYSWKKHPIFSISFASIACETVEAFKKGLSWQLKRIAKMHNLAIEDAPDIQSLFKDLILQLSEENKIVVLIDEYDAPMINNINNIPTANACRDILRQFYTVLKDMDEYLAFIFITGVTQFSKTTIFSGLNNLRDLSYSRDAALLCGFTHGELVQNFNKHTATLATKFNVSEEEIRNKLRVYYNGYQFLKNCSEEDKIACRVYNPTSILLCFREREFDNYWVQTGVPHFLPELIRAQQYPIPEIEGSEINMDDVKIYDIAQLKVLPLLLQTGYVTIDSYNAETKNCKLRYPNQEIKQSFLEDLLNTFANKGTAELRKIVVELEHALNNNDLPTFFKSVAVIFANVPYDLQIAKEKYYQTLFYLTLYLLGINIRVEITTNIGRIDALIETTSHIFIFEFKIDKSAQEALDQIKKTQYYQKYTLSQKPIILVGANFNTDKRNIEKWISENYENSDLEEKKALS